METFNLDARQFARIEAVHRGFLYQHLYAAACLFKAAASGVTHVVVLATNGHEMTLVQEIRASRNSLSLPDCSALVCALRQDHVLLTGDGDLREEAISRGVEVRGLLWLLDQLEASGHIQPSILHAALSQISNHKRCWLPKQEVANRLRRWNQGG